MQKILWALSLCLLTNLALADESATLHLREKLADMTSLAGDFSQTLYSREGETLESSSGSFVLQRPGRFYWHTSEPFEQYLISDQHTLWLYDPDLEQVTVRQVTEDIRKTPAMLLSDDVQSLTESFSIVYDENQEAQIFTLTPHDGEDLFASLQLIFRQDRLHQIEVNDGLHQRTVFALDNTTYNRPVDESKFTFVVPEGVDLLID
ncbi:MAG TPA: outer membrane lipoprotein chaperone LolA [Cellvibrionaceae bacterium]